MLQFDGLQSFCWGGSIQGDTPCLFQLVYKQVKRGLWMSILNHIMTGWWFRTFFLFFHIFGIIFLTDELSIIFQGGQQQPGQPPTSHDISRIFHHRFDDFIDQLRQTMGLDQGVGSSYLAPEQFTCVGVNAPCRSCRCSLEKNERCSYLKAVSSCGLNASLGT